MNKSLRQLFTIVIILFVILGMSTTIITAIRANQLNQDPRNTRALYHEYGAPRGSILASDGSVIAKSGPPSNDAALVSAFWRGRRAACAGHRIFSPPGLGAGAVSKPRAAHCCRANPTN